MFVGPRANLRRPRVLLEADAVRREVDGRDPEPFVPAERLQRVPDAPLAGRGDRVDGLRDAPLLRDDVESDRDVHARPVVCVR
jgi:hypothetical protein